MTEVKTVHFRFYEELNDFLPKDKRKTEFNYEFVDNLTVKDVIASIGVPHAEIDLILVNGISVAFDYKVKSGDHIAVYPVFEALDISPLNRLHSQPLREIKFIIDVHLGKLAKHLRLLGFDSLFTTTYEDAEIIAIAEKEHRIILTRDKGLLKNDKVTHGYWVRATNPTEQLKEIVKRFDLGNKASPFTRCLECNGVLVAVAKETVKDLLPEKTSEYYNNFNRCPWCGRIYWEGAHYKKMHDFITKIRMLKGF